MTASMFGRAGTAAFLLGMGASNHLTDINGDTALHWSAYKGRSMAEEYNLIKNQKKKASKPATA